MYDIPTTLEVGDGVTVGGPKMRVPATVVSVALYKTGPQKGTLKSFVVQHDRVDHKVNEDPVFTPDPRGRTQEVRAARGKWLVYTKESGTNGDRVTLGRRYYIDPHW